MRFRAMKNIEKNLHKEEPDLIKITAQFKACVEILEKFHVSSTAFRSLEYVFHKFKKHSKLVQQPELLGEFMVRIG
jgi:hypothetical protein